MEWHCVQALSTSPGQEFPLRSALTAPVVRSAHWTRASGGHHVFRHHHHYGHSHTSGGWGAGVAFLVILGIVLVVLLVKRASGNS